MPQPVINFFFKEGYEVPFTKTEAKQAILDYFITPSEVLITKQTKKSEKIMDLKQLVYDFKVEGTEEAPEFYINLCTGSSDNLKPELVLESLFGYMNIPYNANAIQIHRLDVYAKEGDKFVSLLDMGEEIA